MPESRPIEAPRLTERDLKVLAFEHQWFRFAGRREQEIRTRFGMSTTRYAQVLMRLIDTPEAEAVDPMTVRRLRRLRELRRENRRAN